MKRVKTATKKKQILDTDKGEILMWKPRADLMFATIIYNVTGAHLALSAIIPLTVDHTHARMILHTWTQVVCYFLQHMRGILFHLCHVVSRS